MERPELDEDTLELIISMGGDMSSMDKDPMKPGMHGITEPANPGSADEVLKGIFDMLCEYFGKDKAMMDGKPKGKPDDKGDDKTPMEDDE